MSDDLNEIRRLMDACPPKCGPIFPDATEETVASLRAFDENEKEKARACLFASRVGADDMVRGVRRETVFAEGSFRADTVDRLLFGVVLTEEQRRALPYAPLLATFPHNFAYAWTGGEG